MSKNRYSFLNLNRVKTEWAITEAYRHNERRRRTYRNNKQIDTSRSGENYHIRECSMRYSEFFKSELESHHVRPPRKGAVLFVDAVLCPTPEWINARTPEEQRVFFTRSFDFLCQVFQPEHIVSAVVHMDETNPHMHIDLVPITRDGRLCFSDIICYHGGGGKKGLEKFQDDYFAYIGQFYPDLVRGIPKSISKRNHVSMSVFKAAPDFFNRHEEIMNAIMTIDHPIYQLSQNKENLLRLYSDISQAGANLILDQDKQLNAYGQRIIPQLNQESKTLSEQVDSLSSENTLLKRKLCVLQNRYALSVGRTNDYKKRLEYLRLAVQSLDREESSRITACADDLLSKREKAAVENRLSSFDAKTELPDASAVLPDRHLLPSVPDR